MATSGTAVSGSSIGLAATLPAGLASAATDAERVTAYAGHSYTTPASCLILQLPVFKEIWETAEDEATVCDNLDEIITSYKTVQKVAPTSVSMRFKKDDPFIAVANALRSSRTDIGVLELTHSNGTDKVWAQIEITETDEDHTATTGKVKFMMSIIFKAKPVRN